MDEFKVILKARQFLRDAKIQSAPVDIERLADKARAKIKVRHDLRDDEAGQTFSLPGKNIIIVNGNHRKERQRFTVLHEIAHIVLDLPSQHGSAGLSIGHLLSYQSRPPEEVLCDVFAAECLLPYDLFRPDVEEADVSFAAIKELAEHYEASITSTGSRFALCCDEPCAFVLMEASRVRYVSSSKHLREQKGWIEIGCAVPEGSAASRLLQNASDTEAVDDVPRDVWFTSGMTRYAAVVEEALALREWDQCLSLISVERSGATTGSARFLAVDDDDEEPLLEELDGELPWPSKKRRR